ncbi:MAG: 4-(cytidine 5'-diphospho)-2-C-methyl-D-erythritol kinase [Opitutales bacterium]
MKPVNHTAGGWLKQAAPAKINLMLSVHGRREDGFHELTSLVVALDFGDCLEARISENPEDGLTADGVEVPLDRSNLILQAAERYRAAAGCKHSFEFNLKKRIPVGAGLGGGSSDAVAAIKLMHALSGHTIDHSALLSLAADLGSDCPFFVEQAPALMRGRGEVLEPLDDALAEGLKGQSLLLFRPNFGIETAWAYEQLAARPELYYEAEERAVDRIDDFRSSGDFKGLLHNVFEQAVGRKYLAIPTLLEGLRAKGYNCLMSGSGSCCFALLDGGMNRSEIIEISRKCWGDSIFWVETSIC